MNTYPIEKNIPYGKPKPKTTSGLTRATINVLKPKESFFVPLNPNTATGHKTRRSVHNAVHRYLGKGNYRTAICQKDGKTGLRVWRKK